MKEIDAEEAKTHFSKLLSRVERGGGERIAITRRGKGVAMLVPVEASPEPSPSKAVVHLRELRRGITWGDAHSLRKSIDDGRA